MLPFNYSHLFAVLLSFLQFISSFHTSSSFRSSSVLLFQFFSAFHFAFFFLLLYSTLLLSVFHFLFQFFSSFTLFFSSFTLVLLFFSSSPYTVFAYLLFYLCLLILLVLYAIIIFVYHSQTMLPFNWSFNLQQQSFKLLITIYFNIHLPHQIFIFPFQFPFTHSFSSSSSATAHFVSLHFFFLFHSSSVSWSFRFTFRHSSTALLCALFTKSILLFCVNDSLLIASILCTISGPTLFTILSILFLCFLHNKPTLAILHTASTPLARYNLTSMSSKPCLTTNLRRIKNRLLQRLPIHLLCDHSLLTHTNNYTSSVHIHKLHFMATVEATFHLNMWPFIKQLDNLPRDYDSPYLSHTTLS